MAEPRRKPHAILIPMPYQGHINPATSLAIKLAAKGFTITYVNTEETHHKSSKARQSTSSVDDVDIFADARASGLDIRYEIISGGLPLSFDRNANAIQHVFSLLDEFSAHVEELMQKLSHAATPPITCLIADTFFSWPSTLSKKFGIPYVSFWTEPAVVFTLCYHMDLLIRNGHLASPENRKDTITYIPGVPAIEPTDLMSYFQETDTSSLAYHITFKAFEDVKGADLVLCNTVQELEPETISALQQEKPFYAIGPLIPAGFSGRPVATNLWAVSDCSLWLDTKPPGSTLYISFGSIFKVSKRDLEEIAYGILESKANFLWVLRPDVACFDEPEPLPKGFLEESHGRGMVIPWCCQMEVLSHPSIGGFLTHCGWNSIMESMSCGVPMLCFPLQIDQLTNRKLVVRDWNTGVDIGRMDRVSREEVSKRVDDLIGGEAGDEVRKQAEVVKRTLETALTLDGSSQKNLDRFIEELKKQSSQNMIIN